MKLELVCNLILTTKILAINMLEQTLKFHSIGQEVTSRKEMPRVECPRCGKEFATAAGGFFWKVKSSWVGG